MKRRICPQCGASLPEAPDSATLRCDYCGITFEVARPRAAPWRPPVETDAGAGSVPLPSRRGWSLMRVFPIVMVALGLGLPIYLGGLGPLLRKPFQPLQPAGLAGLDSATLQKMDVAPPSGGYSALEPLQALPWALGMAQAWRGDAILLKANWFRMRPDGTLDVAQDADARIAYVFISQTLFERNQQLRAQGGKELADTLELTVRAGACKATLTKSMAFTVKLPSHLPRATQSLLQQHGKPLGNGQPFLMGSLEWQQGAWVVKTGGEAFHLALL